MSTDSVSGAIEVVRHKLIHQRPRVYTQETVEHVIDQLDALEAFLRAGNVEAFATYLTRFRTCPTLSAVSFVLNDLLAVMTKPNGAPLS